jgi:hypothetical protein
MVFIIIRESTGDNGAAKKRRRGDEGAEKLNKPLEKPMEILEIKSETSVMER